MEFKASTVEKRSGCKVNLLLNILGKRPDGFHELETVIHPVRLWDRLEISRGGAGVELSCQGAELPTDRRNLVYRAAEAFLEAAGIGEGVKIHLEKRIPLEAGLGGGSSNAAMTLEGLNELFDQRLEPEEVQRLATGLGSDVPFFLQSCPALATGRGERISSLEPFPSMKGVFFLLIHPGFGVSTPWAYQQLARFPAMLNGKEGRARELVDVLQAGDVAGAAGAFYNSLEAPVFEKYPVLAMMKEYLLEEGAAGALMSGSGSTIFGLVKGREAGEKLEERVKGRFGKVWTEVVEV